MKKNNYVHMRIKKEKKEKWEKFAKDKNMSLSEMIETYVDHAIFINSVAISIDADAKISIASMTQAADDVLKEMMSGEDVLKWSNQIEHRKKE